MNLRKEKILATYTINEIIPIITSIRGNTTRNLKFNLFNDLKVTINTPPLRTFKEYGTKCVSCGIEGNIFFLMIMPGCRPSLQLFAKQNDKYILMTCDHIKPTSLGGSRRSITNLQPMCSNCNNKKGNSYGNEMAI